MYRPDDFIRSERGHNDDIEDIIKRDDKPDDVVKKHIEFTSDLLETFEVTKTLGQTMNILRRRHRISLRHSDIITILDNCYRTHDKYQVLRDQLVSTKKRSESGVNVITVLTSPYPEVNGKQQKFSCQWNCYYCPNEPGQPRSYLHDEPAVKRANTNRFDPFLQFMDRGFALKRKGHPVDKIELIVLGGTWESYPLEYREKFILELFFAANEFERYYVLKKTSRTKQSLLKEQEINENSSCRIIGITLETRPDTIDLDSIKTLRLFGCTRVQLGVQHTDNAILEKINRQSTIEDTKRAIRLLKNACYKVDVHLMPNLPGSSVEKDILMFETMLYDPELQADQWKVYPCEVVPWTIIEKWFKNGDYVPVCGRTLV
jgi:ELP3 family radical SAM enzyme/protein acetyltransferase